ncbi:MAG TPA: pentapeptide repeat-containing protein [Desulfobulbaceae bacterium]|nr:pentapeptide repeat-containing protein [Desulfobulbaceae bacterium]
MVQEKSRPKATTVPVVEASPEIHATTPKTAEAGRQQNKTVSVTTKTDGQATKVAAPAAGDVAATAGTPGAAVSQSVAGIKNGAGPLLYTVETPAQAAAEKQALVDRLLDTDACVECDLAGVDLSGKRLKGVDLERANLAGADLSDTNLSEANLKGADLAGANLRGADLSEADLYKADLTDADLTGADLSEASTDSADFTGAQGVPVTGDNK